MDTLPEAVPVVLYGGAVEYFRMLIRHRVVATPRLATATAGAETRRATSARPEAA